MLFGGLRTVEGIQRRATKFTLGFPDRLAYHIYPLLIIFFLSRLDPLIVKTPVQDAKLSSILFALNSDVS